MRVRVDDVNRFLGSVGYCHVRGTAILIQISIGRNPKLRMRKRRKVYTIVYEAM